MTYRSVLAPAFLVSIAGVISPKLSFNRVALVPCRPHSTAEYSVAVMLRKAVASMIPWIIEPFLVGAIVGIMYTVVSTWVE